MQSTQRFCGECGAPQAVQSTSEQQPPVPDAELRMVSVLFCDVVGFTQLAEQLPAEEIRELLSRYFASAATIVTRYGGVVEKFAGDAVMAVWGSPVARGDDAERAVRAALDVVEEVAAFGSELGLAELRARAGVSTGQVASWSLAGEARVAGDRVNTAARIQSSADAGTVFVDDTTHRITASSINYADAGEYELRGKADPVRLWRALRVVAGVAGSQRVDGLEATLVGRDFELRQLKDLFHATVDRHSARLVAVSGAAGVGKSRLRWEFEKYIDGLADTVLWHSGRCLAYGDGVSFWALAEMVRQRFGIAEEDPSPVATSKLAAGLDRWISDDEERRYLSPRLGVLLGVTDTRLSRDELFAGWRLFFERLSAVHPVALVFDDLQWADPGLLDFIEHLLDWSADHPILVLTLARPELAERRADFALRRRNATPLHLDPLPAPAMEALLNDLVHGMPPTLRSRFVEHAAGIPLYAVEMIRALIDRDVVVASGGHYRLVGDVNSVEVPPSLTSLIAARIDALESAERTLVKDLAVLGNAFPRSAVDAVSALPPDEVDRLLASLLRKEILTVHADRLSPERGQYAFTQSLLRTVAHDTLTRRERKARHVAVATHLREAFPGEGEDVAEVIAAHLAAAYEAAGSDPDAAELRGLACEAFIRAGRRAAAVGAPEAAERAYRRAMELAADEPARTALIEATGQMVLQAGREVEAIALFEEAIAAHEAAGRMRDGARLTGPLAMALWWQGQQKEAIPRLRDALTVLREGPPDRDLAEVCQHLAQSTLFVGDTAGTSEAVEEALVLAQALELPDIFGHALLTRGVLLAFTDREQEALFSLEAALSIAEEHDLPEVALRANLNRGDLRSSSDRAGADEALEAGIALARRRGDRWSETMCVMNLVLRHMLTGRWAEAEQLTDDYFHQLGASAPVTIGLHERRATLAAWRGQLDESRQHFAAFASWAESADNQLRLAHAAATSNLALASGELEEALELGGDTARAAATALGLRHETFRLSWPVALEAALRRGRSEEAEQLLSLVGSRMPGHVVPYLRAEFARFRGLLSGDGDDADLLEAERMLGELGYPFELARVQLDHGRWLEAHDRCEDAQAVLREARATFAALGAATHLDRTHEALSLLGARVEL